MHQHIAGPQEVKPLVLKRKRFDVSLHEGHLVAHALLHGSGSSLLDVELGNVQADDSTAKALGQRAAVIASADIEDERGCIDSTGGGDLVKHGVRAWVQALIQRREGTSFVAGPHMRIDGLHLCFLLWHKRIFLLPACAESRIRRAEWFHRQWTLIGAVVLLPVSLLSSPICSITPRKVTVVCQIQREVLTSRNRSLPREERTVCSSPLAFPGIPLRRRREAECRGPSAARGGFPASPQRRRPQRGRSHQR
jgi:hypothetical protein